MQGTQPARISVLLVDSSARPGPKVGRRSAEQPTDGSSNDMAAAKPAAAKQGDAAQADSKQARKGREDGNGSATQTGGRRCSKGRTSGEDKPVTAAADQSQTLDATTQAGSKAFADLVKEFSGPAAPDDAPAAQVQVAAFAADFAADPLQAAILGPSGVNPAAAMIQAAVKIQAAAVQDSDTTGAVPQALAAVAAATLSTKPAAGDAVAAKPSDANGSRAAPQTIVPTGIAVPAEGKQTEADAAPAQMPPMTPGTPSPSVLGAAEKATQGPAPTVPPAQPAADSEQAAPPKARFDDRKATPRTSDGKKPTTVETLASVLQAAASVHQAQGTAAPVVQVARTIAVPAKTSEAQTPVVTAFVSTTQGPSVPVNSGHTPFTRALSDAGTEPSAADQVVRSIRASGPEASREITVQLTPPDLGRVRITFREDGSDLVGKVEVTNVKALQQLEHDGQTLALRLAESGISLKRVEFVLNPQGDSSSPHQGSGGSFLAGGDGQHAAGSYGNGDAPDRDDGGAESGLGEAPTQPTVMAAEGSSIDVEA